MISTRIIRSTQNGNLTPHPFLRAGTPIIFGVTGAPAGPLSSVRVTSPYLAAVFVFHKGVLRFILPLAGRCDFSLQSKPIAACHRFESF
jgi:hypothetical protein